MHAHNKSVEEHQICAGPVDLIASEHRHLLHAQIDADLPQRLVLALFVIRHMGQQSQILTIPIKPIKKADKS